MSNRPGNRATKKRTPPTPPGASPPHQRRRKPSPEPSEAPGNSNETSGPAWVELLHSPISDAIGKLAGHDDLFSSPQRVTGAVAHPAQALFNTLSNRPDAFIGDEWAATLEDLHAVLFRGLQTIDRVLQLTYPTSHVQEPPLPSPEPNDPSKVVLAAISDLRSSLEARLSKLEDSPSPPTTPPSPTRQSRSYAEVSDSAHPSSPSSRHDETTAQPKGPAQPTLPRDQLRYVVNYQGDTPPREQQHSPQVLRSLLRAAASLCALSSQVQFLGSHWNKTGNLILTFSPSTSPSAVDALLPHIRAALTLSADTPITRVVPWSRLVVSSAPARPSPNAPVYSSEAVLDDLVVSNPVFGNVTVTRKPTWVRKPELIQSASSFAISFEDPDGSIARQLLKRHIFLFGAPVTVKRWSNRPRPVTA